MKAFSGVMKEVSMDKRFKFHWKCGKIELSHISFADNLLFSAGVISVPYPLLKRA